MLGFFKKKKIEKQLNIVRDLAKTARIESVATEGKYGGFLIFIDHDGGEELGKILAGEGASVFMEEVESRIENRDFDDIFREIDRFIEYGHPPPVRDTSNVLRGIFGKDNKPLFSWNHEGEIGKIKQSKKEALSSSELVDNIVATLAPFHKDVIDIVNYINGPFEKLYEAGIFVSSIATLKILSFKKYAPIDISEEFNDIWLHRLLLNPNEKNKPKMEALIARLHEVFPIYREYFFEITEKGKKDNLQQDALIALMCELVRNCTDKEKPEDFIKLMATSGLLFEIILEIFQAVQEPS